MENQTQNGGSQKPEKEEGKVLRFLSAIERAGNKLPDPFMLFIYLAIFIAIVSWIMSMLGVSVTTPENEVVEVNNMISEEGLIFALSSMLENFTGFAPLGLVLVMMFGIGLAQHVGFFEVVMRGMVMNIPKSLVTYMIIFTGILGNIASDAAMVIIPPLAAMIYYSIGKHPIAGLLTSFVAVSAGFTANFLIAGTDVLLSGISTEVIQGQYSDARAVSPLDNWYFMAASTIMLVVVVSFVSKKLIEPRLGNYDSSFADKGILNEQIEKLRPEQKRGVRNALIAAGVYIILVSLLIVPSNAILRGEEGTIIPSPFLSNIVPLILVLFIILAVVYGFTAGTLKKISDIPEKMGIAMKEMSGFIVLVFAAAQFIAYFEWTNISTIIAVNGSVALENMNVTGVGAMVGFTFISAIVNLFITSGSALWALLAPVFLPMFYQLGYDPAYTQVAFRMGDSAFNILSPMSPYVVMLLGFMKQYDKRAGLGTLMSLMLPFAVIILIAWIIMFVVWSLLGLQVGPGVDIRL
ncbi:AbgT family transporter [Terribacillus saccharophilus]|uniref:p-aminobenzoyl-glutamate transporter n=1 Tax=Terribacillus saccharophilus TaxID=361277 RepID=A0ABX4GVA3_9BACI|nr:AbgT family transporter [Terribacillus saccharophilus]PAD34455.1 p-aminobenzoyl-glutamate transporter [Terribacillus saccharophilus]PAD95329.1 p-aminobenzoyl-glutamate transporter [Terribacillus saccharophilus]PAD98782.1 p-aminobenzoyl-glutamate transporter [Terribacillus saccharophilus]